MHGQSPGPSPCRGPGRAGPPPAAQPPADRSGRRPTARRGRSAGPGAAAAPHRPPGTPHQGSGVPRDCAIAASPGTRCPRWPGTPASRSRCRLAPARARNAGLRPGRAAPRPGRPTPNVSHCPGRMSCSARAIERLPRAGAAVQHDHLSHEASLEKRTSRARHSGPTVRKAESFRPGGTSPGARPGHVTRCDQLRLPSANRAIPTSIASATGFGSQGPGTQYGSSPITSTRGVGAVVSTATAARRVPGRRVRRSGTSARPARPGGAASWRDAQGRTAGTGCTPGWPAAPPTSRR